MPRCTLHHTRVLVDAMLKEVVLPLRGWVSGSPVGAIRLQSGGGEPSPGASGRGTGHRALHRRRPCAVSPKLSGLLVRGDACSPRGAHLMLKVRCAVMSGALDRDHAVAESRACRPFRPVA
jgi:hypothetical protein